MLNLVIGIMFKLYRKKDLNKTTWEAYMSVFRCREQKFETN